MTITEMIEILKNVHAKHGDLDVMMKDEDGDYRDAGLVKWHHASPNHIYIKEEFGL